MNKQTLPMQGRLPDFLRMQASRDSKPVRENLMSQAADALEAQEKRIAELEGALRELLTVVHDEADSVDEDGGVCVYCFAQDIDNARRVLGGGK